MRFEKGRLGLWTISAHPQAGVQEQTDMPHAMTARTVYMVTSCILGFLIGGFAMIPVMPALIPVGGLLGTVVGGAIGHLLANVRGYTMDNPDGEAA